MSFDLQVEGDGIYRGRSFPGAEFSGGVFLGDRVSWRPCFLATVFLGDRVSWRPCFLATVFLGDRVSWRPWYPASNLDTSLLRCLDRGAGSGM